MFGLREYILWSAQKLDSQGRFVSADILDQIAQSTIEHPELFHGTRNDYDVGDVRVDQNMKGLYMTTSQDAAQQYGDVRFYRLKPGAKILDVSDGGSLWQWMIEQGILDEEDIQSQDLHDYVTNGQIFQYDISNRTYFADDIVATARSMGYDMIKMPDFPLGEDHTAWIATNTDVFQN